MQRLIWYTWVATLSVQSQPRWLGYELCGGIIAGIIIDDVLRGPMFICLMIVALKGLLVLALWSTKSIDLEAYIEKHARWVLK